MSIKIHHGPNGSYKTSGAIQDDVIPMLSSGRTIITNVRGFTRERIFSVFPSTPSSLEVINLDLEDIDDLEKMRTFPQWAPRGAFIIFDEAQLIFLKSWRDSDLKKFDYPGGTAAAKRDDRPINWLDGWTRHRHWNWDIILTTPNIGYIRDDIRMTSEKAYLHSNLAVVGIKGRYKESQHSAQENRPPAARTIVELKKIKQETFRLYESTSTGTVSDTIAGKSIFKQPKILALLALPALCFGYFLYINGQSSTDNTSLQSPLPQYSEPAVQTTEDNPNLRLDPPVRSDSNNVGSYLVSKVVPVAHPFADHRITITGSITSQDGLRMYQFNIQSATGSFDMNDRQLRQSGYTLSNASECSVLLTFETWTGYAVCSGRSGERAAARPVPQQSSERAGSNISTSTFTATSTAPRPPSQPRSGWDFNPTIEPPNQYAFRGDRLR